jgi:hypothetical protein
MLYLCLIIMAVVVLAAMFSHHRATERLIDKQAQATEQTIIAITRAVEQSVLSIVAPPPLSTGASPGQFADPAPMPTWESPDQNDARDLIDPTDAWLPDEHAPVQHGGGFGLPMGAFDA